MIVVKKISGIGGFTVEDSEQVSERQVDQTESSKSRNDSDVSRVIYKVEGRVFLVINKNTFEVRTDSKLKRLLVEKYESVMESRYFGRGGIEVVDSGQLKNDEVEDLIRLSYNLTKEVS